MRSTQHGYRAAVAVVLLSLARGAAADEARATAQALFDDAVQAMKDKAYDRACPKLEEVTKLQPGKVGAMLQLALCYEESGKVASAWARYRAAADAAGPSDERGAQAAAKAAELAPRVPKLTIAVDPANRALRGVSLTKGGREVGVVEWDSALPADPGSYEIVVTAPGKVRWTGRVEVKLGQPASISVPALVDDPRAVVPPEPREAASPPMRTQRKVGFVVGGVGVASLAVAGVTGALFLTKKATAQHECMSGGVAGGFVCTPAGLAAANAGKTFGTVDTVTLLAGAGLLAVGVVLVATGGPKVKTPAPPTIGLVIAARGGLIAGAF
jgi:hypothetical protein